MARYSRAKKLCGFVLYLMFCFTVTIHVHYYMYTTDILNIRCRSFRATSSPNMLRPHRLKDETNIRGFIFIAVMTSENYMETRARAVWDTWGENFSGKLVFFTGKTSKTTWHDMPVVQLDVDDNAYPPRKKSFMMLKYLYDHFMREGRYMWYIRADDDVYIRTDRLHDYLRLRGDTSDDMIIGQPGIGKTEELGKLGLGPNDNFCMGGPSIMMTSGVLRKIAPHLAYCFNSNASIHEDVEVGRCIRRFAGITCPWAYELKDIFCQVPEDQAYHGSLETMAIEKAITLHPVKEPAYMRRIHVHFMMSKMIAFNKKTILLQQKLKGILQKNKEQTSEKVNESPNSLLPWEHIDRSKVWGLDDNPPLKYIHYSAEEALQRIFGFAQETLIKEGELLQYHRLGINRWFSGYMRVHPTDAAEYIFDIQIKPQKLVNGHSTVTRFQRRIKVRQQFGELISRNITPLQKSKSILHLIIPLTGRLQTFKRILAHIEKEFFIPKDPVKLLVVYFSDATRPTGQKEELDSYAKKYPLIEITWLNAKGPFKKAVGLQTGTNYLPPDSLMFYCDVDVLLTREFADRCRATAELGKRVFFPMVFSQFNPKIAYANNTGSQFYYAKRAGLWRTHGLGMVCVHGKDVNDCGGMNTSFSGWGYEDVDLYEKFNKHEGIEVFRAPEPGIVHIYHPHNISCALTTTNAAKAMCKETTRILLASTASVVDYFNKKGYLDEFS